MPASPCLRACQTPNAPVPSVLPGANHGHPAPGGYRGHTPDAHRAMNEGVPRPTRSGGTSSAGLPALPDIPASPATRAHGHSSPRPGAPGGRLAYHEGDRRACPVVNG